MEFLTDNQNPYRNPTKARAFSLVEMLVVMALVGLLLSLATLGFHSVTTAASLTSNGDKIVNLLTNAQQLAILQSSQVEVRIYLPLEDDPNSNWLFLLTKTEGEETRPIQKAYRISEEIEISETSALSTLVANRERRRDGVSNLGGREFVSFRFRSDGSTNLPSTAEGDTWHLTLRSKRANAQANIPPNFYTIRVDADTGGIRSFRP